MFGIIDFIIVFLIFVRISTALIASPVFGSRSVPALPKIFLSLVIAYVVYLTIDRNAIASVPSGWMLVILSFKEAITGLIIGFMLQFVFWGVSYAGTLIGFDMGLTMAEVFNPSSDESGNVVGEFLYYGALMIFFLINGHHYIISSLKHSFSVVPLGKFVISKPVFDLIIIYSASVFIIAVKIASPIIVSFFLVHIGEGIVARIIPQMQVFFVTQPLKVGIGVAMLAAITPLYLYVIKNLLQDYENKLYSLIAAMGA
ncbi:MAG: flagellar biosynthetic protein FliR [Ignavibacteriota bacterium]|jgi:flagellar biosynthetic protein FliR|nr:MAG: flagellar biosynthetic protein FliR [Ignavibacterium sp.]MBL1153655.1 flagellar biosynthetic protein FliR [Ignavibacteriota bacterium]MCO6448213.1 flagellar biosynthetic protein FliR [Ignavibacterium album]MCZ2267997.1 flagellar biosynthetic protein FliR [Ignavibacteriales bacterium]MDX9711425.1 flagellar biosynthetic protein FliR [Ignavibacteriaceae bacterium]